jgi:hypothetical protein
MGGDITMGCVWEVVKMDELINIIIRVVVGFVVIMAVIGWLAFIYQFIEGEGD